METKDLIGLALILLAIPASVLVCCVSQRGRDAAFFLMAAGVVLTEKLDINFVTRYWYRGTTRGFEFTFIDILALGVLVSSFLLPRPGQSRWFWPARSALVSPFFWWNLHRTGFATRLAFSSRCWRPFRVSSMGCGVCS